MHFVLEIIQKCSEIHNNLYFLQWLGVFFDNLTVGYLEKLNEKKKALCSQVQTEKQKVPENPSLKQWQNDIEAISAEISDCTLGIEQILREISQMY